MEDYQDFLESKKIATPKTGIAIAEDSLNRHLFPFQRHCVKTALAAGRFALFEDCGLGKTIQQLAVADEICKATWRPTLILTPLAVADQTVEEARKFGFDGVVRWMSEHGTSQNLPDCIYVAHYEQLDSLPVEQFAGVILDESSILKNADGKTRNELIDAFSQTPYKLCCTATPSPNDPMELGNHAEFLGVMTRNQMLAMFFVHDGGDTTKWRLKKHCEDLFWQWVSTWAIMIGKPHDIGFVMDGYDLPPLNPVDCLIRTQKRDNGQLFNDMAISAITYNQELRLTKLDRLDQVSQIVNAQPDEPFIVWVRQNEEADLIMKLIPDAVEVRGDMNPALKSKRLLGFAKGEFRVLVTKPEICAFGLNYQHCANQVFAAPDFSFEKVYQAIRRSYRFGQQRTVNIYMIATDTMQSVKARFESKKAAHDTMQQKMIASMDHVRMPPLGGPATLAKTTRQLIQQPSWLTSLCK